MSRSVGGRVTPAAALPYLVATDGSATPSRRGVVWRTGYGWVATDGTWELGQCEIPTALVGRAASLVTELRAIHHAMRARLRHGPVVVVTDCEAAVSFLDSWAAGDVRRMPPGYIGSGSHSPMLARLARLVAARHTEMAWSLVKGHHGHLLNEAADSLASVGRRWCRGQYTQDEAERRGRWLVEGFMADRRLVQVV